MTLSDRDENEVHKQLQVDYNKRKKRELVCNWGQFRDSKSICGFFVSVGSDIINRP